MESPSPNPFPTHSLQGTTTQPIHKPTNPSARQQVERSSTRTSYPADCNSAYCARMFATAHPSSLVNNIFVASAIEEQHNARKTGRRENTVIAGLRCGGWCSLAHSAEVQLLKFINSQPVIMHTCVTLDECLLLGRSGAHELATHHFPVSHTLNESTATRHNACTLLHQAQGFLQLARLSY